MECKKGTEVWHTYDYFKDGKPFGFAKWTEKVVNGEVMAEFHNYMAVYTKSALKLSRDIFQDIKRDMATAGCTKVVVMDTIKNVDETRLKYWKFMGFTVGGEHEGHRFAIMEV